MQNLAIRTFENDQTHIIYHLLLLLLLLSYIGYIFMHHIRRHPAEYILYSYLSLYTDTCLFLFLYSFTSIELYTLIEFLLESCAVWLPNLLLFP